MRAFSPGDSAELAEFRGACLVVEGNGDQHVEAGIGSLLGILKSKARCALKRRAGNGKSKPHREGMDRAAGAGLATSRELLLVCWEDRSLVTRDQSARMQSSVTRRAGRIAEADRRGHARTAETNGRARTPGRLAGSSSDDPAAISIEQSLRQGNFFTQTPHLARTKLPGQSQYVEIDLAGCQDRLAADVACLGLALVLNDPSEPIDQRAA